MCSKPRCRRRARDVEESCVFPHGGTLHKRTVAVRRPSLPQCKECVCVVLLCCCHVGGKRPASDGGHVLVREEACDRVKVA